MYIMNNPAVYEWKCKSDDCKMRYIGSTNNFKKRVWVHSFCIRNGINNKFYEIVRNNGGLENWDCIQLEELPLDISKVDLRKKEQEYIDNSQNELINVNRAYLSPEQLKERQRLYYKLYYRENIHKYNQKKIAV